MGRGLDRRGLLAHAAALPALASTASAAAKPVVFVPRSMPANLDPVAAPSFATRTAAMAIFETLYGTDPQLNAMPQMVEAHRMEDDGRHWLLQLRAGLLFHDGSNVTARDCVASLRRWMRKDRVGLAFDARLRGLEAIDDKTLSLRLTKPMPRVPAMLTKGQLSPPVIMPERLANTEADTPVDAIIGSGPFRIENFRWQPGQDLDLIRFDRYHPRVDSSSFLGGRRAVLVERVQWRTPGDGGAVQALRDGSVDWVEMLPPELADDVLGDTDLKTSRLDEIGNYAMLRFNTIGGPTANQAIRQAILAGVDQTAVMETVFGVGGHKFSTPVGLFSPMSEFANSAGNDLFGGTKSPRAIRTMLKDAGYNGESLVVVNPIDDVVHTRLTAAVIEQLTEIGLTATERKLDRFAFEAWRARLRDQETGVRSPGDQSPPTGPGPGAADAWSALCDSVPGADHIDPFALSVGPAPSGGIWPGWRNDDTAARLRDAWIDTQDLGADHAIAAQLQLRVFTTALFVPLGQWYPTSAWRTSLTGQQRGSFPVFWDIARQ